MYRKNNLKIQPFTFALLFFRIGIYSRIFKILFFLPFDVIIVGTNHMSFQGPFCMEWLNTILSTIIFQYRECN